MVRSVADYLRKLGPGRRLDLPEATAGTVRLDAREDGHTEHWYLTIADQHVDVGRSSDDADLVVRADRAVFDDLAAGQLHVSAALLRNDLTVQGDIRLLMMLRRIFPGPPDARDPRTVGRAVLEGRVAPGGWGGPS
ncbi:SCP2 sterol-binding domain-containing protein [Micromonospora krabiensis]|uniref:SCP-2 sterol transfer family protein n=1 Tax=Micromonospora krabiensis TaxID=307121 RepID=A0A1C3N2T5_9ACTN|nr:SCP2 sterol-binding domain-containing protein [Micromonospora krabiensis]SBV26876.1 SCP-2 sterol transfer family protein [Micromonospora krabiensis]